ncbi:MAG: small ribosomal subunit Rsm22 family protein [Opitutaceae bacterium]
MTWADLDWAALDRLRARFLDGTANAEPYWSSPNDLASYDFTYGERIGWKWDQVLRELKLRGWRPASRDIFDWGCGSGTASRRALSFFGAGNFDRLSVWDHSPLAADYAATAAQREFPRLKVTQAAPSFLGATEPVGLLVISHVLNELSVDALGDLRNLISRAEAVIWVEPGTHAISRQLGALRDELLPAFRVVAPCTHQLICPALEPGRERDWCHFFAPPPSEIFADSDWVKFGQRAGIDLRSLPYCFMALDRSAKEPLPHQTMSRVIGRPEHFKPYVRLLNCDRTGLTDLELAKRSDPALYKQLDRSKSPLVYRWQREGAKIVTGVVVAEAEAAGC